MQIKLRFTPAQDEKLIAVNWWGGIAELAREWGIEEQIVRNRRSYLVKKYNAMGMPIPRLGSRRTQFTPDQDAEILSGELTTGELAAKFNVPRKSISHRRATLRAKNKAIVVANFGEKPKPRKSPFARPDWFEEDLNKLTRGALDVRL